MDLSSAFELSIFFFWSGLRDPIACSLLGGVWLQSQNSGYQVTRLCPIKIRVLLFPSTDGHGPFLSPPSEIPPSSLSSANFTVHLSLLLLPPLRLFVVYFLSSPWVPVVTRRPPVCLTGDRCHAAPGCLPIVPALDVLPSRPVWLVLLGLGVGGGRRRRTPR